MHISYEFDTNRSQGPEAQKLKMTQAHSVPNLSKILSILCAYAYIHHATRHSQKRFPVSNTHIWYTLYHAVLVRKRYSTRFKGMRSTFSNTLIIVVSPTMAYLFHRSVKQLFLHKWVKQSSLSIWAVVIDSCACLLIMFHKSHETTGILSPKICEAKPAGIHSTVFQTLLHSQFTPH